MENPSTHQITCTAARAWRALALAASVGLVVVGASRPAAAAPPAIELSAQVPEHAGTGRFEVLEDTTGKLTLDEVRQRETGWQLVTHPNRLQPLGLLGSLGDHISSINQQMSVAKADAVAMERDLALTGAVQQLFLPKQDSFRSSALSLRGFYAPATRCGGDWWWYEPLSNGRVQVMLGDVTGHGAGAAMVTAGVAAAYRALPESTRHGGDVRVVVEALNASLVGICAGAHHMTLAAVEIDPGQGRAHFWSAGAPAALIMHEDGTIDHLGAAGRPLGDPELVIGECELALRPGDRIFIFSDGLPKMAKANGRQLGYRGVSKLLQETLGRSNDEARTQLSASLDQVRKQQPQLDDIAFVLVDVENADGRATEQAAA